MRPSTRRASSGRIRRPSGGGSSPDGDAAAPEAARRSPAALLFGALVAATGVLYALLNACYRTGVVNDDAVYVLVARDLWCRSTASLFPGIRPDFPFPGLPLLLAPFTRLVGPQWTDLEWLSGLASLATVLLLWSWTRRWMSPGEALAAVALFALNPLVARYSGIVMPGPYFVLAVAMSLVLIRRWIERPSLATGLLLGMTLGWGSLMRPEGGLLLICLGGAVVAIRRDGRLLATMSAPLAGWGVFLWLWLRTRPNSDLEYGSDIGSLVTYWSRNWGSAFSFVWHLLRRLVNEMLLALYLPAFTWRDAVTGLLTLLGLGLILLGFLSARWERRLSKAETAGIALFGAAYFGVHAFWHVDAARYFLPLVPFAAAFATRGFVVVQRRAFPKRPLVSLGVLIAILVGYASHDAFLAYRTHWLPNRAASPPWRSFAWVREQTPASARVLSTMAPSVALWTGRYSDGSPRVSSVVDLIRHVEKSRFDYIVDRPMDFLTPAVGLTDDPNAVWSWIRRWLARYPGKFRPVFHDGAEKTTVYRILPDLDLLPAIDLYEDAANAFERGDLPAVVPPLQASLQRYPDLGAAQNLMGVLLVDQARFSEAQRAFESAARLQPDSAVPLLNLATLSHRRKLPGEAQRFLDEAEALSKERGEEVIFRRNVGPLVKSWYGPNPVMLLARP